MSGPAPGIGGHRCPVLVSPEIFAGLEAVRASGVVNMLDRPGVAEVARAMGRPEIAEWIEAEPASCARGVFRGFAAVE